MKQYTVDACIELLQKKSEELAMTGTGHFPKRADFSEEEVVAIKAMLGPWPRALEAAGLKESRQPEKMEARREKRIANKRKRRIARFGAAEISERKRLEET